MLPLESGALLGTAARSRDEALVPPLAGPWEEAEGEQSTLHL